MGPKAASWTLSSTEFTESAKEDHKDRAHTVSAAALYVDVERLSAELRDTKRRLAEANAASAAADAENKKVFDEMLAAANEVADDLERERARCHRAEHELAKARATAHARDETRLGEIIEVKSELALAKASLRVEKEKRSQILAREDHQDHQDHRPSSDDSPNVDSPNVADATLDARRERERLRLELSEARSAVAKAEARASTACALRGGRAHGGGARRGARARGGGAPRRVRRNQAPRGFARGEEDAAQRGGARRHGGERRLSRGRRRRRGLWRSRDGRTETPFVRFVAKPFENGFERLFSATAIALVFFLSSLFVAGTFINSRRRDETLGYECAAQWRRTSGVLDEVLSGTLGAPFRRDDVCDVAAPPAT